MSGYLWPPWTANARFPYPSLSLRVWSNSCHWFSDAIDHLILCHPLLLLSIFPNIRVFSNESALHIRWPKYWSFSFNITPSNVHLGLICFRMDWSLLFNTLFSLVTAFLPRSKCLLIMAAVTIFSDLGTQKNSLSLFKLLPHLFAMKWWDWMP